MNVASVYCLLAYLLPKAGSFQALSWSRLVRKLCPVGGSDLYKHYRELLPHLDTQILTQIYTPCRCRGGGGREVVILITIISRSRRRNIYSNYRDTNGAKNMRGRSHNCHSLVHNNQNRTNCTYATLAIFATYKCNFCYLKFNNNQEGGNMRNLLS